MRSDNLRRNLNLSTDTMDSTPVSDIIRVARQILPGEDRYINGSPTDYWIDSNVWHPRAQAAMMASGSARQTKGLASRSLCSHERFSLTGQYKSYPAGAGWSKDVARAGCWRRGVNRSVDHTLIRGLVTA